MKNDGKSIKLFTKPIYNLVLFAIFSVAFLALAVTGLCFYFSTPAESPDKTEWIFVFCSGTLLFLLGFYSVLNFLETAVIDQNGITVKSVFKKKYFVPWDSVAEVSSQSLLGSRRYRPYIVVKTDKYQTIIERLNFLLNDAKNQEGAPVYFYASKKNKKELFALAQKYAPKTALVSKEFNPINTFWGNL